jgi:hypothetical protein
VGRHLPLIFPGGAQWKGQIQVYLRGRRRLNWSLELELGKEEWNLKRKLKKKDDQMSLEHVGLDRGSFQCWNVTVRG